MRVQPRDARRTTFEVTSERDQHALVLLGCVYLGLSMVASIAYLAILKPHFANDLWWTQYAANRDQALVVDLFNAALATHSHGSIDLFAPHAQLTKPYTTLVSTTNVYPAYARRVVLTELNSIDQAIVHLRALAVKQSLQLFTQYCWVDFNRSFEVAHTALRQTRCANRYAANGAVYLEAVLRNQDWDDFLFFYGGDGGYFTVPLQLWLGQVPAGRRWLTTTSIARQRNSLVEEIAYWQAHAIQYFALEWQSDFQTGLAETITIENALGLEQAIVIKSLPYADETWPSIVMYWTLLNDLVQLTLANQSLIRSADNSFLQPPVFSFEVAMGLQDSSDGGFSAQIALFRTSVGPFLSVDLLYVLPPRELGALVDAFQRAWYAAMTTRPTLQSTFDAIVDRVVVSPTPPAWKANSNFVFYGGNPMCLYGDPLPYVQTTFGFYDVCAQQLPLTVTLEKVVAGFAMVASTLPGDQSCSLDTTTLTSCAAFTRSISDVASTLPEVATAMAPRIQPATQAINNLNVGIMQFASYVDGTNWTLLYHPVLADPTWAFFGWVCLFEWMQGTREVVSFEGDVSSLVLISIPDEPVPFPSSNSAVKSATRLVYAIAMYISSVLGLLAVMCIIGVALIRGRMDGVNLLWFNRIVGSIWVGRPLLFLRGITAILVLSTTQLALVQTPTTGHSRFVLAPRHWLSTLVVAGEATWVLYVAHDFLSVVTRRWTKIYGPIHCLLAAVALFVVETAWPVQPVMTLARQCTPKNIAVTIQCASGRLQIGDLRRVELLLGLLVAMGGVAVAMAVLGRQWVTHNEVSTSARHVLGISDHFLASDAAINEHSCPFWSLDKVSCLMAGLVPMTWHGHQPRHDGQLILDIKLWVVHNKPSDATSTRLRFAFHTRGLDTTPYIPSLENGATPSYIRSAASRHRLMALTSALGTLYAVASIASSVSYLDVSRVNLANDLIWATFNMTGAHAFLVTWLNDQLILGGTNRTLALDSDWINLDGTYDAPTTIVQAPTNFGSLLQYTQLNALDTAIAGLRATDGCAVPWIFTPYCYVDFNKKWEMANSAARQKRCQLTMTANGAMFLEAVLRNIPMAEFYTCWGEAFDIAVAAELRRTTLGNSWLTMLMGGVTLSINDEVALWQSHNIDRFDTQWQNFKQIGLINSYVALNAYGASYRLTLQSQNTSFRFNHETSNIMYWGFANDLIVILQAGNASTTGWVAGQSLIRSSPTFAFANTTLQSVFMLNGTLPSPLGRIYTIVASVIGPFGSTDMRLVPCPPLALSAIYTLHTQLRRSLAHNNASQTTYGQIQDELTILTAPKAWTDLGFYTAGGSLLCPELMPLAATPIYYGMLTLTSWGTPCSSSAISTILQPTRETMVLSAILANLTTSDAYDAVDRICGQSLSAQTTCVASLNQSIAFVLAFMASYQPEWDSLVATASSAIRDAHVEFIQFGEFYVNVLALYRIHVLDPTEVDFAFFAWTFLIDWAFGSREAITFDGDHGNVTVLSEFLTPLQTQVGAGELPTTLAFYLRNTVVYITVAVIVVASLLVVYIGLSRGHIEILNLLELQRVGAIVWVGRPLLFLRSLTAVALLSTATLQLRVDGTVSSFQVVMTPWYKTVLAANEVTWMVAIVNDIALAFTRDHTLYYAAVNSILVWLVVVTMTLVSPLDHSLTIDQRCQLAQMDSQVVCTSGALTIGYFDRLVTIVGVVLGCNGLCFIMTRLLLGHLPPTPVDSTFVYAGARYLFVSSKWIVHNVYYMDRGSAVLNGILTWRYGRVIYGLDVKLWQLFQVDMSSVEIAPDHPLATAAKYALPLSLGQH
ncbi:Aste57867_18614 [Aphanomyces stellatus]|uniref:Aste57867_18614 protein n=1 Tax=Aphanomyces stellatus TaxID=120398 RepID=A0A485LAK7_9STRA|nr:hypothetical protein As57867_018552 [Aphanomyces stellatus]VFT95349.1 Aste57867_18614 [Aphanomyces stellatus]